MKIIYQKPFEDLKIPKSEESENWDIYISKLGSAFIFVRDMWFVLFDSNLRKDVVEDLINLLINNKSLYKEIIDDLQLIDFQRFKEIKEDIVFKSFTQNLKVIWRYYDEGTASSTN